MTAAEAGALALQIAMGIGLSACAGLRAFLPLLATGAAGRLGWISLSPAFEWLSSWPALVVFGVAVVTEILSDKVPLIDHALDAIQAIIKPAAGSLLAASMLTSLTPLQATVLGIVAGGSTAGVVHIAKAKLRLASSAFTGGLANPFLSLGEDAMSTIGIVLSFVAPLLVVAGLAAIIALTVLAARRFTTRRTRAS